MEAWRSTRASHQLAMALQVGGSRNSKFRTHGLRSSKVTMEWLTWQVVRPTFYPSAYTYITSSTFYPNTLYPNNTQTSGINMYIFFMYTYEYVTWHSRESYGITWLYGMNLRIFKTSFMLRSSVKAMRLQWPARTSLMILGRLGFLLLLLLSSLVVGVQPILTGFLHARWKAARFAHRHCEFMRPAAQEIVREGPFIGFQNVRQLLKTLAISVGVFQVSFSWVKELKSIYYTIWEAWPAICWNWKAPVLADLFQSFS